MEGRYHWRQIVHLFNLGLFTFDIHLVSDDCRKLPRTAGSVSNKLWRCLVVHHYLGEDFKVECPTGSGQWKNLWEVSLELSHRLISIFLPDSRGRRPVFRENDKFQQDPYWKDYLLFYEHFHSDNGLGLGASHQTGWTGLVAKLIHQCSLYRWP
jgi:hypothetical protein